MRRSRLFLKNAVILCATSIVLRVAGIAFNSYIISRIGNVGMGLFQLVMSVYALFVSLGIAGINMATTRIVAEELADKRPGGVVKAVRKTFLFGLVCGCVAAALMYLFADFIAVSWLDDPRTAAGLRILAFSIPFISMSAVLKGYFTAVRRVPKVSAIELLEQVTYMLLTILLIKYVMPGGVVYMFMALTLADTLAEAGSFAMLAGVYLHDRRRHFGRIKPARIPTLRILHISVPVATNSFLRSGISSLNRLLVPYTLQQYGLSKDAALGDYGVIHGLVFPILQLPEIMLTSFASLLVPEFADFYQKKDNHSIRRAMDIIFRATFLFSIGVVGIFSYFGRDICNMAYGDASAGVYLAFLAPYAMLLYLDRVVDNTLTGLHQQVNSMVYNLIESFLSTLLILLLVPAYGMLGYIMVLFVGKAINMWMSFSRLVRVTRFPLPFCSWVVKPALCVLCSVSIVLLLRKSFTLPFGGWETWAFAMAIVYILLLYLCGSLRRTKPSA